MLNFIIRKLLGMIPMLLIITLLIYAGIELMPGDVIDFLIPMDQLAEMNPEQIAAFKAAKGLDGPMITRYFSWLLAEKLSCRGISGYIAAKQHACRCADAAEAARYHRAVAGGTDHFLCAGALRWG